MRRIVKIDIRNIKSQDIMKRIEDVKQQIRDKDIMSPPLNVELTDSEFILIQYPDEDWLVAPLTGFAVRALYS